MNIREMQRNFMIKLRQFVAEPEIESDDIEYYLNRAQEEYVKQQHLIIKDNLRNEQLSSVAIQNAIENIRTLIHQANIESTDLSFSEEIYNGISLDLSDEDIFPEDREYAFYLRSRITDGGPISSINCRIIDTNILNKFTKTKFNSPLFREPAVLVEGNILTVIYPLNFEVQRPEDSLVVPETVRYFLTYVTKPSPVNIAENDNCVLPNHTHNEIVDIAVNNKIQDLHRSREIGMDKSFNPENIQQNQQ